MCDCHPIQTDIPRDQLRILEQTLHQCEEQYRRFAIDECDMDEENVAAKIKQARSAPQKNKRLQCIHEAHKALVKRKRQWVLPPNSKRRRRDRKALVKPNERGMHTN